MEQHIIELHNKEQETIFDKFKNDPYLRQNFYFTGGTALSAIYLHHRYSEDLDFFSENEVDNERVLSIVNSWNMDLGTTIELTDKDRVKIYMIHFPNGQTLKVDFAYYPYKTIKKDRVVIDGVMIDSIQDIATNKLMAIYWRNEVKDFVDLLFILKECRDVLLSELFYSVKHKFGVELEYINIAANFTATTRFTYLPTMIKPLTLDEMQSYYTNLAKEMIGKFLTS